MAAIRTVVNPHPPIAVAIVDLRVNTLPPHRPSARLVDLVVKITSFEN